MPCGRAHRSLAGCSRPGDALWVISNGGDEDAATVHSTQKPVERMRRPIINNSAAGEVNYGPFCGNGTTIIAAKTTGRICCATDIDARHMDVAVQRWEQFTGREATPIGSGSRFRDLQTAKRAGEGGTA
jgi:DNA modification methylase